MQQMRVRCPTAKYLGSGVVENYELQFKGSARGAHATIAPKEGNSVPVGVWRIQTGDEKRLDLYEGYPNYYFKRTVPVTMEGRTIRGMAYIMDLKQDFGLPSPNYYYIVEKGYRDCGLNTRVLEQALDQAWEQVQVQVQGQHQVQEQQEEMQLC